MNEKILRDWDNADQYLKDNLNNVGSNLNGIVSDVEHIKGTAEGQFIYDTEAKMTKVVPENVNKGIVAMIGGKTQKMIQAVPESSEWVIGTCPSVTVTTTDNIVTVTRYDNVKQNIWSSTSDIMMITTHKWLGIVKFMGDGSKTIEAFVQFHGRFSYKAIKDNEYLVQEFTGVSEANNNLYVGVKFSDDYLTVKFDKRVQIFDLTAMFGAGNEPTEDEFIEMFGYGYIPYTEGELWNAPVTEVASVGKNCFDENMEIGELNVSTGLPIVSTTNLRTVNYQRVKPSTTYYLLTVGANANVCFYNSNKEFISAIVGVNNNTFTTPSSCAYMKFRLAAAYGLTYNHDVAIIEGGADVYTPYNKTTLLLDKIVDKLPDYGASVNDEIYNYIDFEEMVYHHKVGSMSLWDKDWKSSSSTSSFAPYYLFGVNQNLIRLNGNVVFDNQPILCGKYPTVHRYAGSFVDNTICADGSASAITQIQIKDSSISTAEDLKNALLGQYLNFELKTEELIPLTDLILPFKCEPGGTITFENEHNLDVPSTIIYEKEMK